MEFEANLSGLKVEIDIFILNFSQFVMDKLSEGNLSMNVGSKVNRSALLGDNSPQERHNVSNLLEQQSMGGSSKYQPPQKFFKSDGQSQMD